MKPPAGAGPAWSVLKIGPHHAKMSLTIYFGENALGVCGKTIEKVEPFKGVVIVSPPGHSKTMIACCWNVLSFVHNVGSQAGYLHAVEDEAIKNVDKIATFFSVDNSTGVRFSTLFPHLKRAKRDKGSGKIRFQMDRELKDPNLEAAGVLGAVLGRNLDKQTWDDVVPQSDIDEHTTRERRYNRLTGTWLSRMRGEDTFLLVISNMWHLDDAVSKLRRDRLKNKMLVLVLAVGGPDSSPPFKPIWPAVYPAKELKIRYDTMRNPLLWASAYMADPRSESMRVIRAIRRYDPKAAAHEEFVRTCMFHVSLDPTATNKESADYASLLYGGCGDVTVMRDSQFVTSYRSLRILDAEQFHANQVELSQHCAMFARSRPVDLAHVETRSGFQATADILAAIIGAEQVIRYDPGNNNKRLRLKNAAPWIDEAAANSCGTIAAVEFPGKLMPDGTIGPDERFEWLEKQVLEFGIATEDHAVDALSQLVNYLARIGDLPQIEGIVTNILKQQEEKHVDPRLAALWGKLRQEEKPVEVEDYAFQSGASEGEEWNI